MLPEIAATETRVTEIAEIIQSALAPVFLLAGIGAFLNVLTGRLSRIVDRARGIVPNLLASHGAEHDQYRRDIQILDRRMGLVSRAIWLTVLSAVLTCLVVILLFAGTLTSGHFGRAIALIFIATMIALGLAFFLFLIETRVASRALRISADLLEHEEEEAEAAEL